VFAQGKLAERASEWSSAELQKKWLAALYGNMISDTWEGVGITPVVIDTGAGSDEKGVGVGDYVSSNVAEYASGCVEDKLYCLLDPDGSPQWTDGRGNWFANLYSEPNGLSTVANGDWAGVTA
jgi:hypothetical protein